MADRMRSLTGNGGVVNYDLSNARDPLEDARVFLEHITQPGNNLQGIIMRHRNLGIEGLQILSQGLTHPNCKLRAISLQVATVDWPEMEALSAFVSGPNNPIRELSFMQVMFRNGCTAKIHEIITTSKVECFGAPYCNLSAELCIEIMGTLTDPNNRLKRLSLGQQRTSYAPVLFLKELLPSPNCRLEFFNFYGNEKIPNWYVEDLLPIAQASSIIELNLSYAKEDAPGARGIAHLNTTVHLPWYHKLLVMIALRSLPRFRKTRSPFRVFPSELIRIVAAMLPPETIWYVMAHPELSRNYPVTTFSG